MSSTPHSDVPSAPGAPAPAVPASGALPDALFTQSPLSIALYDADGRVALANAAYERFFGLRAADVPAGWSLFTDAQLEAAGLLPLIRRAYAGQAVTLPAVRYDAAAATGGPGRVVWTQGHCYPVRDGAGRVTHVAVLHADVSAWAEAEAALAEANAQLQGANARLRDQAVEREAVLGQLAEGVIVADAAGRITFVNAAAARLHGVARLDVPPEAYAESYHLLTEDGRPYPSPELPLARAVRRGETVSEARWRIRRPDGSEVVAVGSARPVRGPDGAPLGAVLTLRDETARAAAEDAERAARAEAEAATLRLQDQAAELEAANEELRATAAKLEARTREAEAAGAAAQAERDRAALVAEAGALLASSLDVEDTLARAARLAVPAFADYCVVDLLTPEGDIRRLAAAHVDPALEAVLDGTAAYYTAGTGGPLGDGGAASPLRAVARAGGVRVGVGVDDAWVRSAARGPGHLADIRRLAPRSLVVAALRARGEPLGVISFVRSAAVAAGGRPFGPGDAWVAEQLATRAANALDRARLYRAAREANAALTATNAELEAALADAVRARREAEEANRAKGEFLATMSHELRTPLNAVLGYAELLALGVRGPVSEAQQADLGRIRRAGQYLLALITDVLNYARLDAGRVEYQVADVKLGPLVADLEALVGPQLAAKGLAFDHDACGPDTPDRPHVARADAEKVRQVLVNLLTNAVKFTDRGGRVALACETDRAAGVVRLRVSDTGRGIAPDQLARVFEPFVQVDRHRTPESQQGVGLGLAISRDLARAMGGDLTAESAVGAGSTFTLTLPAA